MAKKAAKKTQVKKSSAKKATAKAATSTATKKSAKKSTSKSAGENTPRASYPEQLKKKVVTAIKKGMTHGEASEVFKVGIHSIPKWIKKHS